MTEVGKLILWSTSSEEAKPIPTICLFETRETAEAALAIGGGEN